MSVTHVYRRVGVMWFVLLGTVLGVGAQPLTRYKAVATALENNPDVKAARAKWDVAKAQSRAAWVPPNPEVGVEFEQLRRLSDPSGYGERSIGVSQSIEFPAKWWLRSKAADYGAQSYAALYESVQLDVAALTSIAFDRALASQQRLTSEAEHDSLLQQFARKARQRLEAGDVAALEVLRAEVDAGRAMRRVAVARSELVVARIRLAALMGDGNVGESGAQLLDGTLQPIHLALPLADLQHLGLKRRADLRSAVHLLASDRANHGASRATLFPDLNVGVSRQTLREAGVKEDLWRFGISMEVPLWGAAHERSRIAAARAQIVVTEADVERLRRDIPMQIETAYRRLMSAADQVKLFDDRVIRVAELAQQSASDSYDQGKATYLEVLDSQRTLVQTRTEYVDILLAYRQAWTDLQRATGGSLSIDRIQ